MLSTDSPNTAPVHAESRLLELDGVRGLAALLVVYTHLFLGCMPSGTPLLFWLRNVSGMSWTGVHLFFILSGFLIARILLRNVKSETYFRAFFTRRALRILPLYYLLLIIYFLLRIPLSAFPSFSNSSLEAWKYFSLTQNFFMSLHADWGAAPLSVTWSVALEEQFYIFLPLVIRFVSFRQLGFLLPLLLILGPVSRALIPVTYPSFLCIGAFDSLFLGTALAWLEFKKPAYMSNLTGRLLATLGLALGSCGMALLMARYELGVFGHSFIAVFWGSFLYLVMSFKGTRITSVFRSRPLVWVGSISYGVYLLHPLISHLVEIMFSNTAIQTARAPYLATLSLLATLLIAHASFVFLESRLIALGKKYAY